MPEQLPALDPESQLGYLVVRVADQLARPWPEALRAHGINARQFSMLAVLARDPGLSQAELARRVLIRPQSLGESLAALMRAGLIIRGEVEPGRAARLEVTDAGHQLLTHAHPVVRAYDHERFAALTCDERDELARLLRKLLD